MTEFLQAPDLIPSQESSKTSIVYGEITQTSLANDLEHFSEVRKILLTKIFDICSHLSLGARFTTGTHPKVTKFGDPWASKKNCPLPDPVFSSFF